MGNATLSRTNARGPELRLVAEQRPQAVDFKRRLEACAEDLKREAAIEGDPQRREKLLKVAEKLVEFANDG